MTVPEPVRVLGGLLATVLAIPIGAGLGWCLFALYQEVNAVLGIIVGVGVLAWLRIMKARYRLAAREERGFQDRAMHSWLMSPLDAEHADIPPYLYELRGRARRFELLARVLVSGYLATVASIVVNTFRSIGQPWWIGLLLGLAVGIVSVWAGDAPASGIVFPGLRR
ncbi:MAG TPA: hypothetical protein VHZ97_20315 [Pseudonocardiaceae bacterium]|nr:hypothetical protein [Pseudonocardiaceae bacterium]